MASFSSLKNNPNTPSQPLNEVMGSMAGYALEW